MKDAVAHERFAYALDHSLRVHDVLKHLRHEDDVVLLVRWFLDEVASCDILRPTCSRTLDRSGIDVNTEVLNAQARHLRGQARCAAPYLQEAELSPPECA